MSNNSPMTWEQMGIAKPDENSPPASVLNPIGGRVFVRSYDTSRAHYVKVLGDSDERYVIDTAFVPVLDVLSEPLVGDTIFYLGEVREDDEINLWMPMRVIWVGDARDGKVPVRTISDNWVVDRYISEHCVPLHLLSESEHGTVKDLAMSLESASLDESRVLLEIFGCEWLISGNQAEV